MSLGVAPSSLIKGFNMKAKSVTIRLDRDLVDRLDKIASDLPFRNRSFVIEKALEYALENPPLEGILKYKGREPGVLHPRD